MDLKLKSRAATVFEEEELRGFTRSMTELQWLLLILAVVGATAPAATVCAAQGAPHEGAEDGPHERVRVTKRQAPGELALDVGDDAWLGPGHATVRGRRLHDFQRAVPRPPAAVAA